ncbi:hypothetical protein UCREL1_4456 [Eutypa lata UCREL1]|uniref:Tachykinin family protein n=1 Tax=Eutypa lata (strain UCR-EL1) TaxID=1287681 RepID=M7TF37_EUTLA|nr:hypothetical protein UCREL1_4456 [Eutypa lata UCREL1]
MLKSDSKSGTTGTPASELAWVTVTHPDQVKNRTFQKKIHNHVMKDIGMSRRRKPKRAQDTSDVPPSGLDINKLSDAHPSPMTDRSLLTRGVSARYQRLHGYSLRDNSAMALALADLAIYAEPLNRKPLLRENANALEHYTASLGLVRERTELVGSLVLDSPPRFPILVTPGRRVLSSELSLTMARTLIILQHRSPHLSDICPVLKSLADLAQLYSGRGPNHWAEDSSLSEVLSIVVSTALNTKRLGIPDDPSDASSAGLAMREILRLASLLLLSAPVDLFASNGDIAYNLRGRLPLLLRSHTLDWTGLEELELWVLVVDALTEVGEERTWAISQGNGHGMRP